MGPVITWRYRYSVRLVKTWRWVICRSNENFEVGTMWVQWKPGGGYYVGLVKTFNTHYPLPQALAGWPLDRFSSLHQLSNPDLAKPILPQKSPSWRKRVEVQICKLTQLATSSKFAPDLAWTGFPITQTEADALGKAEPEILPAYSRALWEPANWLRGSPTYLLSDRESTLSSSDWDCCSDFLGLNIFHLFWGMGTSCWRIFNFNSSGLLN